MGYPDIDVMANDDPRFYPLIGPFLSRREIVAELGFPVWDEEGKTWFVAIENGSAIGFCAVRRDGKGAVFCSDYVIPVYRRRGLYTRLFEARLAWLQGRCKGHFRAVVTPSALPVFKAHGFTPSGGRLLRNYTAVQRECNV